VLRVNHDVNISWNDVVHSQVSSEMLRDSHLLFDQHHQPQQMIEKSHQLMPGGRWMPLWCIPRQRIAVIVPFRAREQHLITFINHLHPFLRSQLLDFIIVVVEQVFSAIYISANAQLMRSAWVEGTRKLKYNTLSNVRIFKKIEYAYD